MPGAAYLHADRVTLRTVEPEDAEFVQKGRSNPEIRVPLGTYGPQNIPAIEDDIESLGEDEKNVALLVCLDEEPIGEVMAMNTHYTRPALAYWLIPEYRGEGYMVEAMEVFIDHLFDIYEIHGLTADTFHTNDGSRAVLERLGFTEEGRLREHRFRRGEYVDTIKHGILRDEWRYPHDE